MRSQVNYFDMNSGKRFSNAGVNRHLKWQHNSEKWKRYLRLIDLAFWVKMMLKLIESVFLYR